MQQQQEQVNSGEQSTVAQPQIAGTSGAEHAHTLSISLKNLPLGTTDEVLLKTLAEIKVTPTKTTLQGSEKEVFAEICFADFSSLCESAAIIDKSKINGQNFERVLISKKQPFSEQTSVFVKNLPTDVTDTELGKTFLKYGTVINCQVLRDYEQNSKQMGLVNFAKPENVTAVIEALDKKTFPGKEEGSAQLIVIKFRAQETFVKRAANNPNQKTNLFVAGLPGTISEEEVRQMFSEYGGIRSIYLKNPMQQDNLQSASEGTKALQSLLPLSSIAYVNMETEEAAQSAFQIQKKNPLSKIKISYYQAQNNLIPRADRVQDQGVVGNTHYRVLFVTKLNKRLTEEELLEVCTKYGKVLNCKLHMGTDRSGNPISLGKAVVTYATTEDAAKAMQKLYFEDKLGQFIQVDFYKNRELRVEQQAQKSDFAQMLTQISQAQSNNSYGYGGRGGYQGRGYQGYQNNQRPLPGGQQQNSGTGQSQSGGRYGGQYGGQGGNKYQNTQQNSQYQQRRQDGDGQGYRDGQQTPQQQQDTNQNKNQRPSNMPQNQNRMSYQQNRQGVPRNNKYRGNQSHQYPNQKRQYQQNNGQQEAPQQQQQPAPIMTAGAFPTLGGQQPPMQMGQPLPVMPIPGSQIAMQMPVPQAQAMVIQQPQVAVAPQGLTTEFVQAQGDETTQKQYLGEQLYPRVIQIDQVRAGRIVGMLLDALPTEQLIETINSQSSFQTNVDRVINAIKQFEAEAQQNTSGATPGQ